MFADPLRWMRANWLLVAACAVLVGSLLATGALVRSVSDRAGSLREAELAAAKLRTQSMGLAAQSGYAFRSGEVNRRDLAVSRRIVVDPALSQSRELVRLWDTSVARQIASMTTELAAVSERVLRLVNTDMPTARRLDRQRLQPGVQTLLGRVARAEAQIDAELSDAEGRAGILGVGITGGVGLFLVAVVVGLTATRRRQARREAIEQAAQENARRLQTLVRHGSDMITVVAPDTTVLYEAGAVRAMLGYEPAELEGRKLSEWLHPDDVPALVALCGAADLGGTARELRLRHQDGTLRTCEARATSLLGDDVWNGIVLNIWDVSDRKDLEERLRHQAFHDGLTGIPNRVLFGERLEHALVRGLRSQSAVTVLLIDLDDFKSINDSLGHPAGDRLLQEAAGRLDETMRAADTIARLGGDEFGVIIDGSRSEAEDEQAARRITAAFARPFALNGRSFPVTATVGIARGGPGQATAERLVRDADLAMYAAKAREKGTYAFYQADMHIATEGRLQLKADLLDAVTSGGQLELYYQPVVSLRGEGIVGLEALLRWNHPTRGQIKPDEFIPLAEETGAIISIGRWVLQEACRQGHAWDERSDQDLSICVNVSARQLQAPGLVDDVRRTLADSGLPPERLVLEITESQLMRNVAQATEVLKAIKLLGVKVAIDDFGTGYSSLSQLERLPVDILKVDREFAGTTEDRADHASLLRAVMEIGDSLHLSTIAEGIETPEQLEELRGLDYPFGQGFLFARPMPVSAVAAMLAEDAQGRQGEARFGEATPIPPARARSTET